MSNGRVGRIFFSRLLENEDLVEGIKSRTEKVDIKAGALNLIGTVKNAVLGFYDKGEYKHIRLDGPLEIASCTGNIAVDEKGETVIHAHLVVSNDEGHAFGGHLMKGTLVGATAELVVVEAVGISLERTIDERTKLKLLKLS
jgi:predicted DNA-binding protein with PD1-like motif